jgi:hypothetical protein
MMYRIFFDGNDGSMKNGWELRFRQSIEDMAAIDSELREGLHVIIYSPNELELEAVLKFDESIGFWRGIPVPGTIKYLDGSA